jgi:hypothetical protein
MSIDIKLYRETRAPAERNEATANRTINILLLGSCGISYAR